MPAQIVKCLAPQTAAVKQIIYINMEWKDYTRLYSSIKKPVQKPIR